MATLDELIKKLEANSTAAYTPLTQQQMQQQANTRYSGVYDQKRLSAQQQYDTADQALAQQLAGLDATYDKQREQSRQNYESAYRAADRQALGRGMQRSSYNNATLANINLKGNEAQQAINDTQAAQAKNIGEQRKLLSQQLGDTLAGLDAAQQSDMLAYLDELEAREYDRITADVANRNNLAMQLYQYQFQKEQADQAQRNWEQTFQANYGGGGVSSGGSTGGSNRTNKSGYQNLMDGLSGGNKKTNTAGLAIAGVLGSALTGALALNAARNKNKK